MQKKIVRLLFLFSVFYLEAIKLSQKTLNFLKETPSYSHTVMEKNNNQENNSVPFNVFVKQRITRNAIRRATNKEKEYRKLFQSLYRTFNVNSNILLALWQLETQCGKCLGGFNTVTALQTLATSKERGEKYKKEFFILLSLAEKGLIDLENLRGEWAGAHGHMQFMPSFISKYGIDFDNDGKLDYMNSVEDSFATAANFLQKEGWDDNLVWGYQVSLKKDLPLEYFVRMNFLTAPELTFEQWERLGVTLLNTQKIKNRNIPLRLVTFQNEKEAFLLSKNFEVLRKWNLSMKHNLTVCLFSDVIRKLK